MNLRKITSMTLLTSLVVLALNSVVLFIVPEGRIAHWTNWLFLGLSKEEWADQHITIGILFLIAGILHMYYNWSMIIAYMKNKVKKLKVFTPSFSIGVLVTFLVTIGTYFHIPPMSTLVELSTTIKESGAKKYGAPPYGRAELSSLKDFAQKERLDPEKAIELLQQAGIQVENSGESLKAIAAKNKLSPQQVYEIVKPTATRNISGIAAEDAARIGSVSSPDKAPTGFGKKLLSDACTELGLNTAQIVLELNKMGITAKPDMIIRDIAKGVGKEPQEIYDAIRSIESIK